MSRSGEWGEGPTRSGIGWQCRARAQTRSPVQGGLPEISVRGPGRLPQCRTPRLAGGLRPCTHSRGAPRLRGPQPPARLSAAALCRGAAVGASVLPQHLQKVPATRASVSPSTAWLRALTCWSWDREGRVHTASRPGLDRPRCPVAPGRGRMLWGYPGLSIQHGVKGVWGWVEKVGVAPHGSRRQHPQLLPDLRPDLWPQTEATCPAGLDTHRPGPPPAAPSPCLLFPPSELRLPLRRQEAGSRVAAPSAPLEPIGDHAPGPSAQRQPEPGPPPEAPLGTRAPGLSSLGGDGQSLGPARILRRRRVPSQEQTPGHTVLQTLLETQAPWLSGQRSWASGSASPRGLEDGTQGGVSPWCGPGLGGFSALMGGAGLPHSPRLCTCMCL